MIEAEPAAHGTALLHFLNLGKRDTGEDLKRIEPKPVFILSTGRTGTQFLAHHLDRDPEIHALHEPSPSRGLRFWTVAYLQGAVDRSMMTSTLRQYRTGFFDDVSGKIYVESNNFLAGFAEALIEEFNEPTLIHVVRDPRTYVRSAINNGASSGLKGLANRLVPFAHLDLEPNSEYAAIRRSAAYWTLLNHHLIRVGENYSGYHLFRYEDLFDAASLEWERMARVIGAGERALGAPRSGERMNQSRRDLLARWDDWPPAQQRVVLDSCGDLMVGIGYDA